MIATANAANFNTVNILHRNAVAGAFDRITFPDGTVTNDRDSLGQYIVISSESDSFRVNGRIAYQFDYLVTPLVRNGIEYTIFLESEDDNGRFMRYAIPGRSMIFYYKNYTENETRSTISFTNYTSVPGQESILIFFTEPVTGHNYQWSFYYDINSTNFIAAKSYYADNGRPLRVNLTELYTSPRGSRSAVVWNNAYVDYILPSPNIVRVNASAILNRSINISQAAKPPQQFIPKASNTKPDFVSGLVGWIKNLFGD